jgi:hypothetical protein
VTLDDSDFVDGLVLDFQLLDSILPPAPLPEAADAVKVA